MNVLGDILNSGGDVEDQEDYGFTSLLFKVYPTITDDITKKKLMNIKLVNLISQRDIQNIEKYYDEINWIDMIENKESDEINQIGENYENKSTDDIEVLKLGALSSKTYIYNIKI